MGDAQAMSLLTELGIKWERKGYKYAAPMALVVCEENPYFNSYQKEKW